MSEPDSIKDELIKTIYDMGTIPNDDLARRLRILAQALQPDDYAYGTVPVQIEFLAELVNEVSGQSVLPPMESYKLLDSHPLVKKGVAFLDAAGYDIKSANAVKWKNLRECFKNMDAEPKTPQSEERT